MLWSICVLLAPVITDRIVVACYRAASVGRIKSVKRHPSSEVRILIADLHVRVPSTARQVGQFVPVEAREGEDETNHLSHFLLGFHSFIQIM